MEKNELQEQFVSIDFNWWLQYLDYLQLVKNNKNTMIDYAKRGTDWLIPTLMN